jgi:imidazole glycerol phosphate synthase glutamine amidotransferase subunit
MTVILDYGAGNLMSVKNALHYLGVQTEISDRPDVIINAERIIFPGVGSFGAMMTNMKTRELDVAVRIGVEKGIPLLGICLGLQALFANSEESPGVQGLGVFEGNVTRYKQGKVPHTGWNKIIPVQNELFEEGYAYFVNSYFVNPKDYGIVAARTDYNGLFVSGVRREKITAVQYHPEKSGPFGLEFLRRWLTC